MDIEAIVRQVIDQLDANGSCGAGNAAKGSGTAEPMAGTVPPEIDDIERIVRQVISRLSPGDSVDVGCIVRKAQEGGAEKTPACTVCAESAAQSQAGTDLAVYLEHALLVPDICAAKVVEKCIEARRLCIAAVTVAPYYVSEAAEALRGSTVAVGAAVGIPNAAMSRAGKVADVRDCIAGGATEIDVALNNLAIKSGKLHVARHELEAILDAAQRKAVIRAAFEHCLFTPQEKEDVLRMLKASGVEYVKIQNVLSGRPARDEDVTFARQILGNSVKIKIDGGVKTAQRVRELVHAGASRIGTSATFEILK